MAELPRKPTIPEPIISKFIDRISKEVEDNVIPVSTGIYTEEGLMDKLKNTPKPFIEDYDDPIFFEIAREVSKCTDANCKGCKKQFGSRKDKPTLCRYCSKFYCPECISHRRRLHPLDTNPSGQRYAICSGCDLRYLNLQLSHNYMETKVMMETSIIKVSNELQVLEMKVEALQGIKKKNIMNQVASNHKIHISVLQKQVADNRKAVAKLEAAVTAQQQRQRQLLLRKQDLKENPHKYQLKRSIQRRQKQQITHQRHDKNYEEQKSSYLDQYNQNQLVGNSTPSIDQSKQAEFANPNEPNIWLEETQTTFSAKQDNRVEGSSRSEQLYKRESLESLNQARGGDAEPNTINTQKVYAKYGEYFSDAQMGDNFNKNKQWFSDHQNDETDKSPELNLQKAKQDLLKEVIKKQQEQEWYHEEEVTNFLVEPSSKCKCELY